MTRARRTFARNAFPRRDATVETYGPKGIPHPRESQAGRREAEPREGTVPVHEGRERGEGR